MNKTLTSLLATGFLGLTIGATAEANTLVVSGTLFQQTDGTTFDTWKLNVTTTESFTVDVAAYEASQSSTTAAGYYTSDINSDGELTWLDPDTHFYKDVGPTSLQDSTNHLARCDDIANNCNTVNTSTIQLTTRNQAQGAADGSVHFRRDPSFDVALAQGSYLYVISDYRLTDSEAAAGNNLGDSFSAPTGFLNPILDHADYKVTFSSNTLNFALDGNTITVSAVPVPAAVWLFGSALAGMGVTWRRRSVA